MPSKTVVARQKRSLQISEAGRTHSTQIGKDIAAKLKPHLHAKEIMPDFALVAELSARLLDADTKRMVDADQTNLDELDDDDEPRVRRDTSIITLTKTTVELSEIVTGLFGGAALKSIGLELAVPRDGTALASKGREIGQKLRDVKLPASRVPGAKFGATAWADRLVAEAGAIDAALKDVAREAREAETTLTAKNDALATHDQHQTDVASLFSSLLDLAGQRPIRRATREADPGDAPINPPTSTAEPAPATKPPTT